jgi:acetyl-CoA carboxylase biotin carboxyl carrier protein
MESTVADEASRSPGPFDVRTVKSLVALMSQHDLSEIDLHDGAQRIRLRRGAAAVPGPILTSVAAPPAPATAAAPPAAKPDSTPAAPAKKLVEIKSPTPGTFYAAPSPDAPPYVKAGARVTPTTVVCQIEAMKIFNEITADCTGSIEEVLAENQQAVEYGQVLFRVNPS